MYAVHSLTFADASPAAVSHGYLLSPSVELFRVKEKLRGTSALL